MRSWPESVLLGILCKFPYLDNLNNFDKDTIYMTEKAMNATNLIPLSGYACQAKCVALERDSLANLNEMSVHDCVQSDQCVFLWMCKHGLSII